MNEKEKIILIALVKKEISKKESEYLEALERFTILEDNQEDLLKIESFLTVLESIKNKIK